MTGPPRAAVAPEPDDEEAAAISAALATLWGAVAGSGASSGSTWRFSGRWWARPVPQRRSRPG